MDSVLSNSQGARSQSQIPSDQITSDVSSAKTADTSKNPITSPTGSSQTASRSSVLIDPVITSAAANSNVPARVKPSVINLVTPVTAENSILPNQISHAIEKPHLRVRVKSKDFPITSTPISRKSPTQTVSTSFALARPNPDDQARIKRMLTDLINTIRPKNQAPLRAHVFQTLVPPMSSPMSSLNIPDSSKSEIGSQPTERLPSPPPKLSRIEPTIFRWPETMASNSSLQAMSQLKNQSDEILSSQLPATARTVVNGNYQQFPATNDLVDRAQFHRANDPTDLARLTKANSSSNQALSHPISTNRIPVDPRNLLDRESFERFQVQTNLAFWQANSTFNQTMSLIPDIDKVIRETQQTPFSSRIANTCLRDTYKLRIPEYSGNSDPRAYIRALYLEILRAQFSPEEIEAACCQLFVENLAGPAKKCFGSRSLEAFSSSKRITSIYVNRFKAIIAKIENPNEAVALLAFRNNLWYKSKFREELIVRPPVSLDDALRCASTFATFEEEINLLLERHRKGRLPQHSLSFANPSSDLEKFCEHHQIYGHSTDECRARAKELAKKQRAEAKMEKAISPHLTITTKHPEKGNAKSESSQESPLSHKKRFDSTLVFRELSSRRSSMTLAVTRPPAPKDSEL
ncbi:unnamed protein product [Microthlaspi erraticum]|uniref:Retrotransposon gag domain-containing protein n=1 Tax=Microthlaspi erraticum TaxID=1685480 RepID=A0A6D2KUJ2_9BRAS|nr:unnamed protein product [Microthlaspi erraticum]